ncbi:hypothetical protein [Enterobacter sp. RIT418]|uniref:hypothetical protein n=1 Tax=Enterobacter sp. RIT418 TaxID=2202164 RepID=UPI0011BF9FFF|nr:hypothetical protein [Enterobacter sp. RIT 418]
MNKRKSTGSNGDNPQGTSCNRQENASSDVKLPEAEVSASAFKRSPTAAQALINSGAGYGSQLATSGSDEIVPQREVSTYSSYLVEPALVKLDAVMNFPVDVPEEKIVLNTVRKEGKMIYTVTFTLDSPEFKPIKEEEIPPDQVVSIPFQKDWHRSLYIFNYPGGTERINKEGVSCSDYINNSVVTDFIGESKARHLTEVAHQGHQSIFAARNFDFSKGVNFVVQADSPPRYDISYDDEGRVKLISQSVFKIKDSDCDKDVDGITISHERSNFFHVKSSGDNSDFGCLSEEKDGWTIKVQLIS